MKSLEYFTAYKEVQFSDLENSKTPTIVWKARLYEPVKGHPDKEVFFREGTKTFDGSVFNRLEVLKELRGLIKEILDKELEGYRRELSTTH